MFHEISINDTFGNFLLKLYVPNKVALKVLNSWNNCPWLTIIDSTDEKVLERKMGKMSHSIKFTLQYILN